MKKAPKLLPVRVLGDDILRRECQEVSSFDDDLRDLAQDMIHTMYLRDGVGLAAPQVGSDKRIFVIDTAWGKEDGVKNPTVVINPIILERSGEIEYEEGCISIPGIYAKVSRPSYIRYSYYDLDGNMHSSEASDFDAVAFQHEYDHLMGKLFIDHLSNLHRLRLKLKLKDIMKTAENGVNIREDIFVAD